MHMSTKAILNLLFILSFGVINAQNNFQTNVSNKLIKTLQVKVVDDELALPVIELNNNEQIEISFDALTAGYTRYAYSITHCDADWKQSTLNQMEYMDGFQGLPIEDYNNSMATTTDYTHYSLLLPNQDIQFKLSGNYAVTIYDEDNPSEPVCTACFSLVEPLVSISGEVTGNTLIDINNTHQQVNFAIDHRNLNIPFPQNDLKIRVYQNNRHDNVVTDFAPMTILNNRVVYENVRELIFDAGNEFRRMEFLTHRFNGMRIDHISFHNPYYHVEVMPDYSRMQQPYQYDRDQNGRFFVNCNNCREPRIESDYYIVHFTVPSDLLTNGKVYLLSDMFNYVLDEKSQMDYNRESGHYEKAVLLKQGHYNYQYLFVPNGQTKGLTAPFEGDHYQAENEYNIYVYYRPAGERYDRLVGVYTIQNTMDMIL